MILLKNTNILLNNFFEIKILYIKNNPIIPKIDKYPNSGMNHIPKLVTISAPVTSKNFSTINNGAVFERGISNLSFKI